MRAGCFGALFSLLFLGGSLAWAEEASHPERAEEAAHPERAEEAAHPERTEAASHLERAEAAYEQIELEETLVHAVRALREGNNSRRQLARIYELIGIAAAALDRPDQAREAYTRMLALNPDAQVDRNLSPQMRSPFLEARGYWMSRAESLDAQAVYLERRGVVRVTLSDPLDMAEEIVVHVRVGAEVTFTELRREADEVIEVTIPGAAEAERVEYYVTVIDRFGNRLIDLGSDAEPFVEREEVAPGPSGEGGGISRRTLWIILGSVGGALVLGGVAAAIGVAASQADPGSVESSLTVGVR